MLSHTPTIPFAHSSGPTNAKLALIGEAWGQQEYLLGKPFVGASGQLLTQLLHSAGIARSECFLSNVLALRPPGNNLDYVCGDKATVGGKDYVLPPVKPGKYLLPQYLPEVERLREELSIVRPNVVIALGNIACWALLGRGDISKIRGTAGEGCGPGVPVDGRPLKVLPTYHPAYVLRNWDEKVIVQADLEKTKRESKFPEVRRPQRFVLVNPSMREAHEFAVRAQSVSILSVDIETWKGMISMVGFALSRTEAIVIPFIVGLGQSYWPSLDEECEAWEYVQALLATKAAKLFQNGLFDLQYLLKMGLTVRNCTHDTMLLHHALYPELRKGLGFLGSIYTNEPAWKLMRLDKHQHEELKRDE